MLVSWERFHLAMTPLIKIRIRHNLLFKISLHKIKNTAFSSNCNTHETDTIDHLFLLIAVTVRLLPHKFREYSRRSEADADPPLLRHGVAVEEDGEQHGEDFSSGGNSGAHQGVEVSDGVKDERLADC